MSSEEHSSMFLLTVVEVLPVFSWRKTQNFYSNLKKNREAHQIDSDLTNIIIASIISINK